jgi:hypothetical protein
VPLARPLSEAPADLSLTLAGLFRPPATDGSVAARSAVARRTAVTRLAYPMASAEAESVHESARNTFDVEGASRRYP